MTALITSVPLFGFLVYLLKHGQKHTESVVKASESVLKMQEGLIKEQAIKLVSLRKEVRILEKHVHQSVISQIDLAKIKADLVTIELQLKVTETHRDNLQIENQGLKLEIMELRQEVDTLRKQINAAAAIS